MNYSAKIEFLLKNGYSQALLAESIDVNQSMISRILTGKLSDPRASVAERIDDLYSKKLPKAAADE
jgi:transcriptional regulator with XRE-family HTH domain